MVLGASIVSYETKKALLEIYDNRCLRCYCSSQEDRLTVDHVIPKILGGGSDNSNLEILCFYCNIIWKNSKFIVDFRKGLSAMMLNDVFSPISVLKLEKKRFR